MALHYKRIRKLFKDIFIEKPLTVGYDDMDSKKRIIDDFEKKLYKKFLHISDISFYSGSHISYALNCPIILEIRYKDSKLYDDVFDIFFEGKKLIIQDKTKRNYAPVANIEQIVKLIEVIPENRNEVRKNREKREKIEHEKYVKEKKIFNLKAERAKVKLTDLAKKMNLECKFKFNMSYKRVQFKIKINDFRALSLSLPVDELDHQLKSLQKNLEGVAQLIKDDVQFDIRSWDRDYF